MRSYSPRHKMRSNPDNAAASAEINDPTTVTDIIEIVDFLTNDTLRSNLDLLGVPRDAWLDSLNELTAGKDKISAAEFGLLAEQLASSYFPAFKGDATELWGELSEPGKITTSNIVEYANALLGQPAALYTNLFEGVLNVIASDTEVPAVLSNDIEKGTLAEVYAGSEGKVYAIVDAAQPSFSYYAQQGIQGPVLGIKVEDAAIAVFDNDDYAVVDVVYVLTVRPSASTSFNVIVLPELYDYVSASGETIRSDFYGQLIDLNAYVSLLLELEVEPFGLAADESVDFLLREGLVAATRRIYDYYSGKSAGPTETEAVATFVNAYPDKIHLAEKIPAVLRLFNLAEFPRYGHEQLVELYALVAVGPLGLLGDEAVFEANALYSDLAATFKARLCAKDVKPRVVEQIQAVCSELLDETILQGYLGLCSLPEATLFQKLMEVNGFEKFATGGDVPRLFEFRGAAYRRGLEGSKVIASGDTKLPESAGAAKDPGFDGAIGDVANKGVKPSVELSTGSKVVGGVAVASALVGLYALVRHSQGKPIWSFE